MLSVLRALSLGVGIKRNRMCYYGSCVKRQIAP